MCQSENRDNIQTTQPNNTKEIATDLQDQIVKEPLQHINKNGSGSQRKRNFSIICVILLILFVIGCCKMPYHPLFNFIQPGDGNGCGIDFLVPYAGTVALEKGCPNIYVPGMMSQISTFLSNGQWNSLEVHPIPFFSVFLPYLNFDFSTALLLHNWLNIVMYALGITALCFYTLGTGPEKTIIALLLCANGFVCCPMFESIWMGQVCLALTGLLCFLFIADEKKWYLAAGLCLSLAILYKMYPALLLFYFAKKRSTKTIAWTFAWLGGLSLWAAMRWGFGHFANYLEWQQTFPYINAIHNIAIMGGLSKIISTFAVLKVIHLSLIVLGLVMLWKIPCKTCSKTNSLLNFSLWCLSALVLAPLAWTNHLSILTILFIALVAVILESGNWQNQATYNNNHDKTWAWVTLISLIVSFYASGSGITNGLHRILISWDNGFIPLIVGSLTYRLPMYLNLLTLFAGFMCIKKYNKDQI